MDIFYTEIQFGFLVSCERQKKRKEKKENRENVLSLMES